MSKNILIIAAVLGTGLIVGVFFAFSTFVMGHWANFRQRKASPRCGQLTLSP